MTSADPITVPWGPEERLPLKLPPTWQVVVQGDLEAPTHRRPVRGHPAGAGDAAWLYAQDEPSGGFLEMNVRPSQGGTPATVEFAFYDEEGRGLYRVEKAAP